MKQDLNHLLFGVFHITVSGEARHVSPVLCRRNCLVSGPLSIGQLAAFRRMAGINRSGRTLPAAPVRCCALKAVGVNLQRFKNLPFDNPTTKQPTKHKRVPKEMVIPPPRAQLLTCWIPLAEVKRGPKGLLLAFSPRRGVVIFNKPQAHFCKVGRQAPS